ncbi:MFS superfamily sulfate permease-like transporter [Streptomyces turgidiscabies]|uniref:MFS superfamily sulfate permease-like transporter n=1 Tax=Streptomyces turgidiscabies TaxID=85558 RepID=A0ABU0S1L6_9ACTN|nr:MFS superfamily sulfate permease-like transporter [Streptomyces turgidiscabies]
MTDAHLATVVFSAVVLVFLFALVRYVPPAPGPLVAFVLATVAVS